MAEIATHEFTINEFFAQNQFNANDYNEAKEEIEKYDNENEYVKAFIFWSNYYLATGLIEINLLLGMLIEKMSIDNQKQCFETLPENQKLYLLEHGIKFHPDYTEEACKSTKAYQQFKFKIEHNVNGMENPKNQKDVYSSLSVGEKRAVYYAMDKNNRPGKAELAKGIFAVAGLSLLLIACFVSDLIISQVAKPATEFVIEVTKHKISEITAEIAVGFVASAAFYKLEEASLNGLENQPYIKNFKAHNLNNLELEDLEDTPKLDSEQEPLLNKKIVPDNKLSNELCVLKKKDNNFAEKLTDKDFKSNAWKEFNSILNNRKHGEVNSIHAKFDDLNNQDEFDSMQALYDSFKFDELLDELKTATGQNDSGVQNAICYSFVFLMAYTDKVGKHEKISSKGIFKIFKKDKELDEIICGILQLMTVENQRNYFLALDEDRQIELLDKGLVLHPKVLKEASEKSLIGKQFKFCIQKNIEGMADTNKQIEKWNKLSYGRRMLTYNCLTDKPKFSRFGKNVRNFSVKALTAICFLSGILTTVLTPVIPLASLVTGLIFSVAFSTLELLNLSGFETRANRYSENYTIQERIAEATTESNRLKEKPQQNSCQTVSSQPAF